MHLLMYRVALFIMPPNTSVSGANLTSAQDNEAYNNKCDTSRPRTRIKILVHIAKTCHGGGKNGRNDEMRQVYGNSNNHSLQL